MDTNENAKRVVDEATGDELDAQIQAALQHPKYAGVTTLPELDNFIGYYEDILKRDFVYQLIDLLKVVRERSLWEQYKFFHHQLIPTMKEAINRSGPHTLTPGDASASPGDKRSP